MHKNIVIIYHGGCPDGFGGAYAAWKKFGDTAEYIPQRRGEPVPSAIDGAEVYFIDFCLSKEEMDNVASRAKRLVILDHHESIREVTESFPEHVYDVKRSGATIAWGFLHPETPVPTLLQYVQEGDLFTFGLPDSRAVLSYTYAQPFNFATWDEIATKLETTDGRAEIIERGGIYSEHFQLLVSGLTRKAELVLFEGHECYLVGASSEFASDVGHTLAEIKPPIALVVGASVKRIHVSLRSVKGVDVSVIAAKYGGGGHPRASAFMIPYGMPVPWTPIKK